MGEPGGRASATTGAVLANDPLEPMTLRAAAAGVRETRTVLIAAWWPLRQLRLSEAPHRNTVTRTAVQAAWLGVAVLGFVALVGDITAIV